MPRLYTVYCPAVHSHCAGWMPIPSAHDAMPLMAPGKPGRNADLVKHLQQCPSCVVRFVLKP
jgi:hypothetical protein